MNMNINHLKDRIAVAEREVERLQRLMQANKRKKKVLARLQIESAEVHNRLAKMREVLLQMQINYER